jgi:hypothetical protein
MIFSLYWGAAARRRKTDAKNPAAILTAPAGFIARTIYAIEACE